MWLNHYGSLEGVLFELYRFALTLYRFALHLKSWCVCVSLCVRERVGGGKEREREHAPRCFCHHIQGYKQHKAFIIAQGPLKSTVRNFWKMIYDRKSAVIVMLTDLVEGGQEACAQYWPSSGSYQYGEYTVELMGEEPLEGFVIRDMSVTDSRVRQISIILSSLFSAFCM